MKNLIFWVVGILVALWVLGFIFRLAIRLLIFGTIAVIVLYAIGVFGKRKLR